MIANTSCRRCYARYRCRCVSFGSAAALLIAAPPQRTQSAWRSRCSRAAGVDMLPSMRLSVEKLRVATFLAGACLAGCGQPVRAPDAPASSSPSASTDPGIPPASPPPPATPPRSAVRRGHLDADETKELGGVCKPFMDAWGERVYFSKALGNIPILVDAMRATLAAPPKMDPTTQARCLHLFERAIRSNVFDHQWNDASSHFQLLKKGMKKAVERTGKLCPSSTHPVPRQLALFTITTFADWSDPAWHCLDMGAGSYTSSMSVQLESRTDPGSGKSTFLARAASIDDEQVAEWRVEGQMQDGTFTFGDMIYVGP